MNKTVMMGHLANDPEIRYTKDGKAVCNFRLAVNRYKEGADFFPHTAFGKTAEFIEKSMKKGVKVAIISRAQIDEYTDKQGVKHYNTTFYIDDIEFAEKKQTESKDEQKQFTDLSPEEDTELPFNFN